MLLEYKENMPQAAAVLAMPLFGSTVGGILANVAVAYLAGKILAPKKPTSQGKGALKQIVRGGIEPRKICYGEGYTSGPLVYAGVSGDPGGDTNKYLHLIVALTTHPVENIDSVYIDELEYSLITGGKFTPKLDLADVNERLKSYTLKNLLGDEKREPYMGLIRVIPVTGKWMYYNSGTTDQDVIDDYTRWLDVKNSINAEGPVKWGPNHRLDRCSFVYLRLTYDQDVWSSIPNIYVKMRGANLYNPLADQDFHVSPYVGTVFDNRGAYSSATSYKVGDLVTSGVDTYVCIRNNSNTSLSNTFYWQITYPNLRNNPQLWTHSNNWALAVLDYLLDKRYGLAIKTSGILNEIDWPTLLEAVKDSYDGGYLDISRTTIPASRFCGDGNVVNYPKFNVSGIIETSSTPIDNLETLFTAANGEMAYAQGKHFLRAGIYQEPYYNPNSFSDTIVDESYLGDSNLTLTTAVPNTNIFNSVNGVYISNDDDSRGEPVEMAPIYMEEYIQKDGQEYIEDRDYPVTLSEKVARNLAKQSLEESRHGKTINLTCNIKILKYKVGDVIAFKNDVLGFGITDYQSIKWTGEFIPKIFKIVSMSVKEGLNVEVGLQEITYTPYNPALPLSDGTLGSTIPNTDINTPLGAPTITTEDLSDFYAQYDSGIAANIHYVDLGWTGATGITGTQFGYALVDYYEVKWVKIGSHLTDGGTLNSGGALTPANITINIVSGSISSVNIVSGGFGYWKDGYLEINTNLASGDDKALLQYSVDGSGAISSINIVNGGSGYTNGTNISIASDLPLTIIADPEEDGDTINKWKSITVLGSNRRQVQPPITLRLDEQLGDYIFAVRAVMGWKKSIWSIITKEKSGDEIVYGVPTPITEAFSYGDDTHVYAQFDLTNSKAAGDNNLSYIEWFIGDWLRSPDNYTQFVTHPLTGTRSMVFKSYLQLPANWANFDVDGRILTPIVSISLAPYQNGTSASWRPYWLWARVVNTGGVASSWYPLNNGVRRGVPTGLGRGDAQNLLPLPTDYVDDESLGGGDETPVVTTDPGGGPYPNPVSGSNPTAPVEDGGGDPDSDTGIYTIRDVNPIPVENAPE
jgi:hypothetical protein